VLFDCIIAGSDTTASTIAALLFRLYQEPHCRSQVLEELGRAGPLDALQLDEVDEKLAYLQACVKETLRLYPPVPMVGRKSVAEVGVRVVGRLRMHVACHRRMLPVHRLCRAHSLTTFHAPSRLG